MPLRTRQPVGFFYRPAGAAKVGSLSTTLLKLATDLATDWMPGHPRSISDALADVLAEMLESVQIDGEKVLAIRPDVADYEKQWRVFISWVLGVATSRAVVAEMGYPYIAPVSLFSGRPKPSSPHLKWWSPFYGGRRCSVRKPKRPTHRNMPDYILATDHASGKGPGVAFLEAKGTQRCLKRCGCPDSWRRQAGNAVFLYEEKEITAERNLVVATRNAPSGERKSTRAIYVRAWNRLSTSTAFPFAGFRELLRAHYMSACAGIGLLDHARLLAMSPTTTDHTDEIAGRKHHEEFERPSHDDLAGEVTRIEVPDAPDVPLHVPSRRDALSCGDERIRIGLTAPAIELVRHLSTESDERVEHLLREKDASVAAIRGIVHERTDVYARDDGIVSFT